MVFVVVHMPIVCVSIVHVMVSVGMTVVTNDVVHDNDFTSYPLLGVPT